MTVSVSVHGLCYICLIMIIFIRAMTGHLYMLEVEPSDTIGSVKSKLYSKVGIPTTQQILSFSGRSLEDGGTLVEYRVMKENSAIVHDLQLEVLD